jgi:hypothetical protein
VKRLSDEPSFNDFRQRIEARAKELAAIQEPQEQRHELRVKACIAEQMQLTVERIREFMAPSFGSQYRTATLEQVKLTEPEIYGPLTEWLLEVPDRHEHAYDMAIASPNPFLGRGTPLPGYDIGLLRNVRGFAITGGYGSGKTYAVHAMRHALAKLGYASLFVTGDSLSREFRKSERFDEQDAEAIIQRYATMPFVVIDDLDKLIRDPKLETHVFGLINARYIAKLPVIVTANASRAELCHMARGSSSLEAVMDRFAEAIPLWLETKGPSLRIAPPPECTETG